MTDVHRLYQNIAQSLTDMDLIFIEEAFERLLLDYDRGENQDPLDKSNY